MRAKWRKKRVRRLKRKRRKMRARRYVYPLAKLERFHTDTIRPTASKRLVPTRSQPSSTKRTNDHDNYTISPPAHHARGTDTFSSNPDCNHRLHYRTGELQQQREARVKLRVWHNDKEGSVRIGDSWSITIEWKNGSCLLSTFEADIVLQPMA